VGATPTIALAASLALWPSRWELLVEAWLLVVLGLAAAGGIV
jgi:hypothetical protein